MRILINDFAGHPFPLQLSRRLANCGHNILHTYFAANNTPKGATGAEPGCDLKIKPLEIGRKFNKHSLWSRRFADVEYGKAVAQEAAAFRPDVVLSGSMPLDAQKHLLRASQDCGAAFVFWLQDVLSVATEFVLRKKGVPFAGLAGRFYSGLERRLLNESDAIVCITPQFEALLNYWRIPESKTFVIENWAPLDEIELMPKNNPWAREHGIADKFCFLYSGTLGMKHRPELLLEMAKHFEHREDVAIVVVAQGAGADWLKQNNDLRPGALELFPFQPYQRLSEVLSSADVLVSLLDSSCGEFAVPSKTLSYLCASRPLLMAAPNSNLAAQIVIQAAAGQVVSPDSPESFVLAAEQMMSDAQQREQFGANARQHAERTFEIGRIAEEFLQIFNQVVEKDVHVPVSSQNKEDALTYAGD